MYTDDDEDDRDLDEWLERQSTGSELAPGREVSPASLDRAEDPEDAADLDAYLARTADDSDVDYEPAQMNDDETPPKPARAKTKSGNGSTALIGGMIASGIGSFLQRKPFDDEFWGGQVKQYNDGQNAAQERKSKREDRDLNRRYKEAQIDRLGRPIGPDARTLELRNEALELQRRRLGLLEGAEGRRGKALELDISEEQRKADNASPVSDRSTRMREFFTKHGVPRRSVENLSADDMRLLNPRLGTLFDQAEPQAARDIDLAGRKAGAVAAAQQPYAAAREEREHARDLGREGRAFADDYAKNMELELDMAGLMQDIDAAGGAAPEGLAERFKNTLAARGIDPNRLEPWQAKHMIMELWARNQTGAAISQTEDGRFVHQVGLNVTASPEQVEAAYKVLGRLVSRRLRARSVAHPEAAREVARSVGLDEERWFGGSAPARKPSGSAPAPAQPAAATPPTPAEPPPPPRIGDDVETAKTYRVTTPGGKRITYNITDTEAAALKAKGFTLELSP